MIILSTLTDLWAALMAPPLPVVLAAGAGTVVATAGALSGRAARHPELPAQRWTRPLPAAAARVADARATRVALRGLGLAAAITGIVVLAAHDAPVDGVVAIPVLTAVSLAGGPVLDLVNPLGAVPSERADRVLGATAWLAALCAVALSTRDPRVLAVTAAAYLAVQAATGWRTGRRADPVDTLSEVLGHLAPIGRDADRRPAWRNPLVAAAHATLPDGMTTFAAVVVAASVTHAVGPPPALGGALPALWFAAAAVAVAGVLRLCVIRPFFRGAVIPLVAAYGLVAAGRWWQPVDLVVFVLLHALAVAVLHRQALARHDLRTARAVQFPLRAALVASVIGGLTLLAGG